MNNLSEFHGIPLSEESGIGALTLPGFLRDVANQHSSREAIRWRDLEGNLQHWTYSEFYEESCKVARALLAAGVVKGTRVGILCSNRPEWLFCLYGAAMAGAVTVALNTFSTRNELQHQLKSADVSVVILEAEVASHDFIEDILTLSPVFAEDKPDLKFDLEFPFLRKIICIDTGRTKGAIQNWDEFLEKGGTITDSLATATADSVDALDDAVIFFSSGSTALPKAIRHTHRAAALQCWRMGKLFELDNTDRTWNANGYFFSGNFAMAFGTLSRGGCLVMLRYFDPDKALELIQNEKISCVIAWPHQEERLKECVAWDSADFSSLRRVVANSAFRSHPSTHIEWSGFNGYGMTETFTFVSAASGEEHIKDSQGLVFPGNILRIIDPESGEILPIGETGEIIVKGPTLSPGYLHIAPEDTFDDEGFIHTSDAGCFTKDGHLLWKGRLSDIIKTGGANVSPTEIDTILFEHPDIQQSNTIGIPHDTLGEIVVSCIVLHPGKALDEKAVKNYAKQYLSGYKVPRKILFFDEDELPTTGSNKVRHKELREIVTKILSREQNT